MKFLSVLLASLIVSFIFGGANSVVAQDGNDSTEEPALFYELTVDGKKHRIRANQEIELKDANKTRIKLVPNKYRTFKYGGLRFRYPAEMTFGADHDGGDYTWSIEGVYTGLLLFAYAQEQVSKEEFAEMLADEYEDSVTKTKQIKIGDKTYEAIAVSEKGFQDSYLQMVIELECEEGSRLLVLGDYLEENGDHSEDYLKMIKMVGEKFEVSDSQSTKN